MVGESGAADASKVVVLSGALLPRDWFGHLWGLFVVIMLAFSVWGGNQECVLYTTMCRTVSHSEEFSLIPCNFKNSFCTTKQTISYVKRQPSGWEKIIANEATDRF